MRLDIRGQTLDLLGDRAVWWHEGRTVILADIHLGKAAAFRESGLAVPEGDTEHDLDRIDRILRLTGAARLLVVGDMFHHPAGFRPEVFQAISNWRAAHRALHIVLVPGNHDRDLHRLPAEWGFESHPGGFRHGGLRFVHDPAHVSTASNQETVSKRTSREADFLICGHIHPAISLGHRNQSTMKAPCFWLAPQRLVLPGFGGFTGLTAIRPDDGDRVFAIDAGRVIEVPEEIWISRARCAGNAQR